MLGQLSGQDQTGGGLDLARGDGGALVDGSQLGGLRGEALEDVLDERVQDGHGLVGDTGVGVDLLQDTVNVGGVGLLADLAALLLVAGLAGRLAGLLGGFRGLGRGLAGLRRGGLSGGGSGFGCHSVWVTTTV